MFYVRQAMQEDYLDIANIHFTSWNKAYLKLLPESYINKENILSKKIDMWQELIACPNVKVWIAHGTSNDNQHNSVGFIGYFNKGTEYEITTLYVLPEYHRLGIGTQLMRKAITEILNSTHNPSLYLWVLKDNVTAIHFYKNYGFIASGEHSEELYEGNKIIDIKMIGNTQT